MARRADVLVLLSQVLALQRVYESPVEVDAGVLEHGVDGARVRVEPVAVEVEFLLDGLAPDALAVGRFRHVL